MLRRSSAGDCRWGVAESDDVPAVAANPEIRRVRALRLRAQGLVPGAQPWADAADVARGMLAMQAQDAAGVRWALSLRAMDSPTEDDVLASLADCRLVRNRPSRGTLQITAPEDLYWLSATLTPRSNREAVKRRPTIELTDATVEAAEAVIRSELAGGVVRTRPELVAACAAAGVELTGNQAGHILRHLTEQMAIVFADPGSRVDSFALAEDWIGERREPADPLGEVVIRFVASRGPVTRQDIGRWAYLAMGSVDAGLEAAADVVERVTLAGTEYLVARGSADISDDEVEAALATPLLLPAFDEYLIGYGTRGPQLAERFFERIVPGRNGMFKPIVVVDGEIVGIWSRRQTATKATVTVEPFTRIPAKAKRALAGPVREYGRFLGREAVLL